MKIEHCFLAGTIYILKVMSNTERFTAKFRFHSQLPEENSVHLFLLITLHDGYNIFRWIHTSPFYAQFLHRLRHAAVVSPRFHIAGMCMYILIHAKSARENITNPQPADHRRPTCKRLIQLLPNRKNDAPARRISMENPRLLVTKSLRKPCGTSNDQLYIRLHERMRSEKIMYFDFYPTLPQATYKKCNGERERQIKQTEGNFCLLYFNFIILFYF